MEYPIERGILLRMTPSISKCPCCKESKSRSSRLRGIVVRFSPGICIVSLTMMVVAYDHIGPHMPMLHVSKQGHLCDGLQPFSHALLVTGTILV